MVRRETRDAGAARPCGEEARGDPLPVLPAALKAYVLDLARKGRRLRTIRVRLGCLGTWCRIHGHVLERKLLTNVLRGIAKVQGKADQAEPLIRDAEIERTVDAAREAAEPAGVLARLDNGERAP